ncbi:MAG: hypothetical protein IJ017_03815 [Oscillospiraceae bacterium]|nr:hypothetical protein [Oscillospiraceae bacterium]
MFSNEQVNAYKNITAPEEMREKVLSSVGTKKKSRTAAYRYAGLAACLVVIIALSLVFSSMGGATTIYTDGQVITENGVPVYSAVSAMSARGVFGIELEAELEGKTVISSADGTVYVYDENGELTEGETDAEKVSIIWDIVPTDTEKTYVLTFENSRGVTEVTLLFDETAGWMLCCDK